MIAVLAAIAVALWLLAGLAILALCQASAHADRMARRVGREIADHSARQARALRRERGLGDQPYGRTRA